MSGVKKVSLVRLPSTDQGTFGTMQFGGFKVLCLELPWRNNRQQRSCVPTGTYECRLVRSPRFGNVYKLLSVPGRSNVLIHPANLAGDVDLGWSTELQGCIAPCLRAGAMRNKAGILQSAGLVSRPAVRLLMTWANNEPFELEIS